MTGRGGDGVRELRSRRMTEDGGRETIVRRKAIKQPVLQRGPFGSRRKAIKQPVLQRGPLIFLLLTPYTLLFNVGVKRLAAD